MAENFNKGGRPHVANACTHNVMVRFDDSTGATIGPNLRFIGAIGANIEFIYDIIYDTKRFTMTLVESSMTSNIDHLDTNSQSA